MSFSISGIPFAPIAYTKSSGFDDFQAFIKDVGSNLRYRAFGVLKVIPPLKWRARKSKDLFGMMQMIIPKPSEQRVSRHNREVYELKEKKMKPLTIEEFKNQVAGFDSIISEDSPGCSDQRFYEQLGVVRPWMGNGTKGTLFDVGVKWGLSELPNNYFDCTKALVPGRNYPQLQFSSCGAFINWQESSEDAFKLIFHHNGKPRCWFAIPEEKSEVFRKRMAQEVSSALSREDKVRNFFITPHRLDSLYPELKISKMFQFAGEFMIIFPRTVYMSFDFGFNIVENVDYFGLRLPLELNQSTLNKPGGGIRSAERDDRMSIESQEIKNDLEELMSEEGEEYQSSVIKSAQMMDDSESYLDAESRQDHSSKDLISEISTKKIKNELRMSKTKKKRLQFDESRHSNLKQQQQQTDLVEEDDFPFVKSRKRFLPHERKSRAFNLSKRAILNRTYKEKQKRKNQLESMDEELEVSQDSERHAQCTEYLKVKDVEKLRGKVVKGETDDLLVENWILCDECRKWRKILEAKLWKRLKKHKSFKCKDVPTMNCRIEAELWLGQYYTIPKRYHNKIDNV